MAASRGVSVNKLMEELGTMALASHDAEVRFATLAARADKTKALEVLARLDAVDAHADAGSGR
jgi:hypothetical protein